jgi:hypothetical protein
VNAMEFVAPNAAISALLFAANRATSFKGVENCSWKRRALMFSLTMVQLEILQVKFLAAFRVKPRLQDNFWIALSVTTFSIFGVRAMSVFTIVQCKISLDRVWTGLGLDKIRTRQVSY